MVIKPFEATFPQVDQITDKKYFFNTAKENYRTFLAQNCFQEKKQNAFYVYEITKGDSVHCGLLAAVSVQEYIDQHIKRHEHTLVPKEEKQAILLHERQAVVKPILLVHRTQQDLISILNRVKLTQAPAFELNISAEKGTHRFWTISKEEDINAITSIFQQHIDTAYIADGHHRFSAIARLYQHAKTSNDQEKYAQLMCALFPSDDLEIHNYNRVVNAFEDDISALAFLARLSHFAYIKPLEYGHEPQKEHEMCFYLNSEWFSLEWRPSIVNEYARASLPTLDVSMFNYCILEQILGYKDIRNDKRIKYVEGPKGLRKLEELAHEDNAIAFCLYPLKWSSFFRVIDYGLVLPPKSTWFEPRMLNGLVVQRLD